MVSTKEFNRGVPRPFPGRAGCILTLPTIDGRNTRLNFVIFVVWSALTVGGWRWHGAESWDRGHCGSVTLVLGHSFVLDCS